MKYLQNRRIPRSRSKPCAQDARFRVSVIYKTIPHYRIAFFDALKRRLAESDVELEVLYGRPARRDVTKRDTAALPWAKPVTSIHLRVRSAELVWHHCLRRTRGADLIIVEQATRLLENNALIVRQLLGGPPVAFWGHGKNLKQHEARRAGEWLKRRLSRLPRWWFVYTNSTARVVAEEIGYPNDRITVVQNSIDTEALREAIAALSPADLDRLRDQFGISSGPVAIYCGSLYKEKRIAFLLAAARELRARLDGFHLLIVGDGPERPVVEAAVQRSDWIHYLGAQNAECRAGAFAIAEVSLMPGLVGLGIVDSFATECPLVTIDLPFHSPEIEYLRPDENGLLLPESTTAAAYAEAVRSLLLDCERLNALRRGCRIASGRYTNAEMVERFTAGVLQYLGEQ